MDTLGDGNSSNLRDIFIFSDTLAYAVGEIYIRDSVGDFDPIPYNLVRWDGKNWTPQRVTINFRGTPITLPLVGIFGLSPSDIWLAGSIPIHGDGNQWVGFDVRSLPGNDSASVSKCWGTNGFNMYFVGLNGTILRFNGSTWTKLEGGTRLPINDIWGAGQTILCVASDQAHGAGKKLLRILGSTVSNVGDGGLPLSLSSLWFKPSGGYFVVGDGLFRASAIAANTSWESFHGGLTKYYSNAIHGSGVDIVVVGAFGDLLTYNGSTWHNHHDQTGLSFGSYYGVGIKGDLIVAVGQVFNKGIALIGKRSN